MAGRPKSKLDWWHSINQLMVMFGVGLGFGIYGPSLIDLAEIYSTTTEEVAMMNSARAIGMFIGSCVGGYFYNFVNDQILTLTFLIVYGVGTVVSPLLPSITYLHVCGTVAGLAFGIAHIGSQVRLLKIWSEKSASAIQAFHSAWGVGSMVGPFVVAPFLSVRDGDVVLRDQRLPIPYGIFGLLYVLMSASMIAAYIYDPATIKRQNNDNRHETESKGQSSVLLIMAVLFIYLTISVNTEHSLGTFISFYATESPHLRFTRSKAAILAGIYWATFTGGRLLGIFLAFICDLKQLLMMSHSLIISASALMIVFKSSEVCAWIGTGLMGVGISSLYGTASGLVFDHIHLRHAYVGAVLTASCLGLAISAYAVPPFIGTWPMFLQYYVGGGNILNTVFMFVIFIAVRGRDRINAVKEEQQNVQMENAAT